MLHTQGIKNAYAYRLNAIVQKALQEQSTPGIAFMGLNLKTHKSISLYQGSYQGISSPLIDDQSYYDLASLSKPLVTALWTWELIEHNILKFDSKVSDFFDCSDHKFANATVAQLLNHSSGLPAHHAYYNGFGHLRMQGANPNHLRSRIYQMILRTSSTYTPSTRSIYSDLGYMLLASICEANSI